MENRFKGMIAAGVGPVVTALTGAGVAAQDGGGGDGGDGGQGGGGFFFFDDDNDIAAAGNGGTATASANGGAVLIGDVNSGGNVGSTISVGDVGGMVCDKWGKCHPVDGGAVAIDGGDVTATTSIGVSADGGVAIADASGGDGNIADAEDNFFVFVS